MLPYLTEVVTGYVYKCTAADAFQVEMAHTVLRFVDVLIAGAGLAVNGVPSDQAVFHQLIKLTVYGSHTHRSPLSGEVGAYLLDVSMLVLVGNKVIQQFFLLSGIVAGAVLHDDTVL